MTSYASLQTDMENAGAIWQDKEVVFNKGLITSRSLRDLEAFNKKKIEVLADPDLTTENIDTVTNKYSQSMQQIHGTHEKT